MVAQTIASRVRRGGPALSRCLHVGMTDGEDIDDMERTVLHLRRLKLELLPLLRNGSGHSNANATTQCQEAIQAPAQIALVQEACFTLLVLASFDS